MRRTSSLLAAAAALALAACSGDEPADNVSANGAEASNEAAMTNDPSNPFGQAEMQMHERMTATVGANASETWVRKMIEHHRGAVEMSEILLAQGGDERFLEKARMTVTMQMRDIAELERMLSGGVSGGSGPANPYGPVEARMHDQMMAARGADPAETWARKMIAHHQGAIDMSEVLIQQGGDPEVLAVARRTADEQRREIAELETMLAGGAPAAEAPKADAATPPAANRTPAAQPKARETPSRPATRPAQPKATPRPAPRQEPSPPPKTECLPEHRAAGHC